MNRREMEAFVAEGRDPKRQADLREAARLNRAWDLEHRPLGTIDEVLDFVDQLREIFGEPKVDTRPWRGDDFRL